MWCDGAVCLELDDEVRVERVRDFIPCKDNLRHGEELAVGRGETNELVRFGGEKGGYRVVRTRATCFLVCDLA